MEKNIIGIYEDEHVVLNAIHKLKENNIAIVDVFSPYPSHDIIHALHYKTRLQWMEFIYGVTAISAIFGGLYYAAVIDYPLNIGGKPSFTFSFIILMFVGTILLTGLASVVTFFIRQNLGPGKKAAIIDPRVTDDKFALVVERTKAMDNAKVSAIEKILFDSGASEVNYNSVEIEKN
ncbi:MAG: hypothetical protein RIS47_1802 [Bacteroidota bacterium]|jgi:hypothetical protein